MRGRVVTRARIAGVSVQQWGKNMGNLVKQRITKIFGNKPIDELNGFQRRRLTDSQSSARS